MRALITGGAGFIGFHLAKRLVQDGVQVDLIDDFSRAVLDRDLEELLRLPTIRMIRGNLAESSALSGLRTGYDYLFHFAAVVGVTNVRQRPYDVLTKNTLLLANAIEIARGLVGLKRFVFTSTSEVYAGTLRYFEMPIPTPESTPLAVDDPQNPRVSYMLSKIYGEAMCRFSGIPYSVVRPHNIYGPRMGMAHVIPELLQRAEELLPGKRLKVFSPHHRRTFCYVDDAVELIVRLAKNAACEGEVLNVGRQDPELSIAELARIVLKTVGKTGELEELSETPGSPRRRAPDMSRTVALTHYTPGIGIEEGVRRTYAWYRDRVFEGYGACAN